MPVDPDEYRRQSHEVWERIATNWGEEREFIHSVTAPVNERMIERLDPTPGDTILDLAAGTGDTGFLAATIVGEDGRLISTDFASAMVDAAREVSTELGLGNVEHRVLDAERMDLDDSSVDKVLCRFGYMLMADPAAALGETRRVMRDDGRLCFASGPPPTRTRGPSSRGWSWSSAGTFRRQSRKRPGSSPWVTPNGSASWSPGRDSPSPR